MVGDTGVAWFWEKPNFHICACFHLPKSQYWELHKQHRGAALQPFGNAAQAPQVSEAPTVVSKEQNPFLHGHRHRRF
jgi:hypothetical protein